MLFVVRRQFLTSSHMKSQESEEVSLLGVLLRPFLLSNAGSRPKLIEQDCHCLGAVQQRVSKQAIVLVYCYLSP